MGRTVLAIFTGFLLLTPFTSVLAQGTPEGMMDECRSRAVTVFGAIFESIDAAYEGQRTDGTHAVNGSVNVRGPETFQCSFDQAGYRIEQFLVNTARDANLAQNTPESMVDQCRDRAAQRRPRPRDTC